MTSFGTNFGQASTYRAVLTRHMSPMDYARTAPTITAVTVAPGTESIVLTFSEAVCGAPETGCTALTADHFEVMHYGGVETEAPTLLPISFVDLVGSVANGYRLATLSIDLLGSSVIIDSNDYVIVRTAKNSRFSDTFITDRTIFSQASTPSGMLHLQGGALKQALPTLVYSLTNPDGNLDDYSVIEGDAAVGTTSTFAITRAPTGYDMPSATTVTITRTSDSNAVDPDNFAVTIDGTVVAESAGVWTQVITFAAGDDSKTIDIQHEGNDAPNDDYVYTINIEPASIPGGGSQEITYTIVDDEDDIPPTIPDGNIVVEPGATQVTLEFDSAYDRVGSQSDINNVTYTRDVDYVISITRLASGDKPMLTLPSITLSATDLGLPFAEGNSMPPSMQIEILLTRNDVVLAPSDAYRVTISVIDRADRFSSQSYEGDFTMLGHEDFPNTEDFRALLRSELAGVDCGTGSDSDGDGIANAYELSIGTDCNSDVNDYIGSVDPATAFPDVAITFLSPPDVLVVAAGASTYTQIDTGVTCERTACNNLKAFIVSSGLTGDFDDDAVAMVTGICPDPDDVSSVPNSCWVDDAFVDGNVRPIPLQLGYNLIDWVAADNNGNLILSTRQKQFIYVAPVVVLDGVTDLVLSGMAGTTGEGIFRARFLPQDGDQDGDPLSGNSISFIDGTVRTIDELPDEFDDNNASCNPPEDESGIDIIEVTLVSDDLPLDPALTEALEDLGIDNPQLVALSGAGIYTYTAEVEYTTSTSTVCRIDELSTTSITFGDGSLDPFYLVGNQITVERGIVDEVASVRIEEIEVYDLNNFDINFLAVAPGEEYAYEVEYSPTGAQFSVKVASNDDEQFMLNDNGDGTGSFSIPSQTSMTYIALTATIMEGTSILNTHTVVYPIVDDTDPLAIATDDDNDGVPDNRDDINNDATTNDGDSTLLSNRIPGATTFTTIEVPSGYRVSLGNIARRNSRNNPAIQAQLNDPILMSEGIGTPPGNTDEGVFEFNVSLPEGTNTAFISIPLATALSEDKGYGKYLDPDLTNEDGIERVWTPFDTSADDAYYSAQRMGSGGVTTCPPPVDPSSGITQWGNQKNRLVEGNQCVLLVIKDGGFNDSDGQVNGVIVDPGAPAGGASAPDRGEIYGPNCQLRGVGCRGVRGGFPFSPGGGGVRRGLDLLPIDSSDTSETAVENDGSGQQFIGVYPDATLSGDIITAVGVTSGTFTVTEIRLNIISSHIATITYDNIFRSGLDAFSPGPGATGNEFTFTSSDIAGVAIDVAESFLKSLKFGINSDEPTGPVTLELSIRGSEGATTTEVATRPITEENDPVELGPVAGTVPVLVSDLISGPVTVLMTNVNDGGDGSGITFEINPSTFNVPTAADSNVTETLTLSGDVTPEGAFTLSISQSSTELAEANLITTLTFDDSRGSTVSRTITIRIMKMKEALIFRIKVFLEGAR